MIEVEASTPRFRKRFCILMKENEAVGAGAAQVAKMAQYGTARCTFALEGRILDANARASDALYDKARVELVLL